MSRASPPRILVLEAYHGGSHRHLAEGLRRRLPGEVDLWTLPARKWKWRMRGGAIRFARRARGAGDPPDLILATTMTSLAELRGLLPPAWREVPLVAYFHENQVAYPVRHPSERDYQFAFTNLTSALSADRVLWNSAWNLDSFLDGMADLLQEMPDERPTGALDDVRARSEVLPVPVDVAGIEEALAEAPRPRPEGPARILWNHRWEHDKNPETFFEALFELADRGLAFEVSVLGERFRRSPAIFAEARERLGDRIVAFGRIESRRGYYRAMASCDLAVSTAGHEFQGLAILEAAACGCTPLVPDALVYPEIWPEDARYPPGELTEALAARVEAIEAWRSRSFAGVARAHSWEQLLPRWEAALRP